MASHQTFVTPGQESRFTVQRNSLRSRTDDRTPDRKKEDSIALPPVRGKQPFHVLCLFLRLRKQPDFYGMFIPDNLYKFVSFVIKPDFYVESSRKISFLCKLLAPARNIHFEIKSVISHITDLLLFLLLLIK